MLSIPSSSTTDLCDTTLVTSDKAIETRLKGEKYLTQSTNVDDEYGYNKDEEENFGNTIRITQNPPVICEQGPSTPSSPTVPSSTGHFSRARIPSLIISDSIDRMNLLTPDYGCGIDSNKLTPYRTYSTSDLGSSPQSTLSITSNSLSNPWSAFRDYRKSNPESDTDSDVFSKDLLSPSTALSPSPFSPFSDCSEPPDTPQSLSAVIGNSPSISPHLPLKSLHFSFDDTTSVEDDMDWSDLPETSTKEVNRSSHRVPNFAIETVLSFSDEDGQVDEQTKEQQRKQEQEQQKDDNNSDSPSLQVDEGFIDDSVRHRQTNIEKDEYVEKQLAEWKIRFSEQNRLLEANQLGVYSEAQDTQTNVYRFKDWNGLERVGGPLMASSLWQKSRSSPNIASVTYPCSMCSEAFEKQEELQRHITLQHPDLCEMCINVRRCLLCKKIFEDNEALKWHVVSKHSNGNDNNNLGTFKCQQCGLTFDTSTAFDEHIANVHQRQIPLVIVPSNDVACFYCGQQFSGNDKLMQHLTLYHLEAVNLALTYQGFSPQFIGQQQQQQQQQISLRDLSLYTNLMEKSAAKTTVTELFQKNAEQRLNGATDVNDENNAKQSIAYQTAALKKEQQKDTSIVKQDEHYPCPQCPQVFDAKGGLREHLFANHLTQEGRQKYCQQEVPKQPETTIVCKADKNAYRCIACNLVFPTQERCNVHLAMEHPSQPLINDEPKKCNCIICKQTVQVQNTGKQQRSFKRVKDELVCNGFRCPECGKLFPSRNHVEEHEAVVHQGPSTITVPFGKFVCQFCNEGFSNQDRLTKHIASRHRNPIEEAQKAHKCTVCGKGFARTDMLSRHMRLHKGDKPFACSVCGQEFSRSDHLTTHMRTHSGEKPYRCPFCCYAASRRDMMNRHLKTHSKSPEHIRAQEARMNIEVRSSSSSPNPAKATIGTVPAQFGVINTSGSVANPAANTPLTLMNTGSFSSASSSTSSSVQNQFLLPNPSCVLQFPQYLSPECATAAAAAVSGSTSACQLPLSLSAVQQPLNCPTIQPDQAYCLTPVGEITLSDKSSPKIPSQQLLQPVASIPLAVQSPVRTTKLPQMTTVLETSAATNSSLASTVLQLPTTIPAANNSALLMDDTLKVPSEIGSTNQHSQSTGESSSSTTVNLLTVPVKTEVTFDCSS